MNQVTPKAGTLKRTKLNTIQNVTRKLIASVLMLAMIAATPASVIAGIKVNDSCCGKAKTVNLPKAVVLELPSREMMNKADSEMNSNLLRSLTESKVARFAKAFEAADAMVNACFVNATTISVLSAATADESINSIFAAEHIRQAGSSFADADINDLFTAEVAGIRQPLNSASADAIAHAMFQAENISMPGTESFSKADLEITQNMQNENAGKYAVNVSK